MYNWSLRRRRQREHGWKTFEDIMTRFFPQLIIKIYYPLTDKKTNKKQETAAGLKIKGKRKP